MFLYVVLAKIRLKLPYFIAKPQKSPSWESTPIPCLKIPLPPAVRGVTSIRHPFTIANQKIDEDYNL